MHSVVRNSSALFFYAFVSNDGNSFRKAPLWYIFCLVFLTCALNRYWPGCDPSALHYQNPWPIHGSFSVLIGVCLQSVPRAKPVISPDTTPPKPNSSKPHIPPSVFTPQENRNPVIPRPDICIFCLCYRRQSPVPASSRGYSNAVRIDCFYVNVDPLQRLSDGLPSLMMYVSAIGSIRSAPAECEILCAIATWQG